ncbi:TIMELESS-interacting protein [Microplitis mediator]|uniref:TIMELESS-interacting protein n=1 Tax=Microplitis mediator TaxID=375433 RepID=UPI00255764AC|nr:TIMELESS-interacting protein [Microplitis mediator]
MTDNLDDEINQRSLSGDEGQNSDDNENKLTNNDQQENDENNEEAGRKIDPKTSRKRIVRNPIPKLNPARLKGPKGIHTIEEYFTGFKFHGKGHEKHDLDRIMKRLEHWGHRLFPKYQFDDFIEKLEALGTKKELQAFLTRYRRDMMLNEVIIREEDDVIDEREKSPEPVDEFDLLIAEQIEKTKQATVVTETTQRNNDIFDSLLNSQNQQTLSSSQQVNISESINSTESDEEIKKKIERNRQLAIERRQAKLRKDEQIKKSKISESSIVSGEIEKTTKALPHTSENLPQTSESIPHVQIPVTNSKDQNPTLTDEEINSIFNSDTQPLEDIDIQENNQQLSNTVNGNLNNKNVPKPLLTDEELEREINEAVNQFAQQKRPLH